GVDLAQVKGSGPGGRVMKEDVEAFLSRQAGDAAIPPAQPSVQQAAQQPPAVPRAPAPAQPSGTDGGRPEQRQRLSRRRLTIARRLVEAQQTAAMLTTFNEIDMNAVVELRKRRKESFKEITGANLGFMSFFVKAAVGALKAFPQINSELQGEEMVLKRYYDIGIAIGDVEGLVVPVLRDADGMTFAQIENAIATFAQKVKDRTLSLEDLKGGTFTITNGGVFGSMMSTPILNPPQVGILGMHAIKERPVVADGQIVAHPVMYIALTYDHRVVDGRDSVLFLARIKELIEDPERLLLEG
ncbi:MAG TPA: dihydrolipoyllysine-residue succinyltransferase, partial [Chloroflexota bacterium]|nr:dihydrolipoyllysine-residue succinyltransferase [Chloroflexota bacterium]